MNIQVLSDLHFDQHGFLDRPPPSISPDADVLILAGDIINGKVLGTQPEVFCKWYSSINTPIIYVLGNHEYDELLTVNAARLAYSTWLGRLNPNTILLEDGMVEVMGVSFIGASLFTKLSPLEEVRMRSFLNSDRMPKDFTGEWWGDKFRQSKRYLVKTLKELKTPTVVVTHFAPSYMSVGESFKGYASNCYFVSDLDNLLEQYPVKYWIHGHTHTPHLYQVGETKVVCNPHGYIHLDGRNETCAENFNPSLLLEINV